MDLGQRIRQARAEAGLSQRQLCGGTITRNMLSQIEHGTVQPSLGTLRYLAGQLGRPVSFFLDEQTVCSCNTEIMERSRSFYAACDYPMVLQALEDYRTPDPVFDWEFHLLRAKACMKLAEQAIREGRQPYAGTLLERAEEEGSCTPYFDEPLRREYQLLCGEAGGSGELSDDDRFLLLKAEQAAGSGDWKRCRQLLDAAENRDTPRWNYLRGGQFFAAGSFSEAAACYTRAEQAFPQCIPRLEQCYKQLEDYKMAYYYACKQKET